MSGPAVVGLATETDLERLRQMALLLEAENARLHRRLVELTRALAAATGATHTQLELEIARLQEQLAARTRALFGRSSERRGGAEREETTSPPAPRRGHGPRSQPELPRVDVVHTAAAPVAPCAQCGGALEPWPEQYEDAEEIDVVERSFRLVRHRRQKYRCRCGGGVVTAPGPREAHSRGAVLGRLRGRDRGGEVPRSPAARPAGAADGAGRAHGRHADAVGSALSAQPPSHAHVRGARG